jgi:uncharacterized repeat protein (TIGR03803 family)
MPLESMPATSQPIGCGRFKKAILPRSSCGPLAFTIVLVLLTLPSHAQTFTVLHNFEGVTDGAFPEAGLLMDSKGNLYGTTVGGGNGCAGGCGTVFKLTEKGETVLYRFKGSPDGDSPSGGLLHGADGNLYGVTNAGGPQGCGTVFRVYPDGTETAFSICSNGQGGGQPNGDLAMDAKGNLYGTSLSGGTGNSGFVFKVAPDGADTVLHSFCTRGGSRCADGEEPSGGLVMAATGTLYGTTKIDFGPNGTGSGAVFKVTETGEETTLHIFSFAQGSFPSGGLIQDAIGNLYGTTLFGGTGNCGTGEDFGCGTVYKVDLSGNVTVLYDFCSASGCADGSSPSAGLFLDAHGNLYGTTLTGGTGRCTSQLFPGCGTVFEVSASGIETVLHTFTGTASDGAFPYSRLVMDANGNLYGTASGGGTFGLGIVFEITP